jgi:hypothetical protein
MIRYAGVIFFCAVRRADPHHFDVDLDPFFHFDADPDPTFLFCANPDPDPAHYQRDAIFLRPLAFIRSRASFSAVTPNNEIERPRSFVAPF